MKTIYILTKNGTTKNYIKSFNPQTGYMKFTTQKQHATKMKHDNALAIKHMLDHNNLHATIESA